MNAKSIKSLKLIMGLALVVMVLSSCNRGGYGCPYELEAAGNILGNFLR